MWQNAPLFPTAASELARHVDYLFFFALFFSVFFSLLIAALLVVFGSKYRRLKDSEVGAFIDEHAKGPRMLELTWSAIPFGLLLIMADLVNPVHIIQ